MIALGVGAHVHDFVVVLGRLVLPEGGRIDSFSKLEGAERISLGTHVHIASYCHLNIGGGALHLGNHCFFASGTRVITGGNKPDGLSMSAASPRSMQSVVPGEVIFEDYSGTYSGVIVNPGVTFGEGAVALPGSVVRKSIPAWEIWGGNPCVFVRKRQVKDAPLDDDWQQRDADLRAQVPTAQRMMRDGVNAGYAEGVVYPKGKR